MPRDKHGDCRQWQVTIDHVPGQAWEATVYQTYPKEPLASFGPRGAQAFETETLDCLLHVVADALKGVA